jgi:hypothetical protein
VFIVLAYTGRVGLSHVSYPLCVFAGLPDDGRIRRSKHGAEKYNECIIFKSAVAFGV